ncbi:DUF1178 family protein [Labrys monachus]|uniref:DUF1178 family protein n=1 Tax=Labrys monachus TaxID=217067 RepID=A0ABU0FQK2_9HYPH|nr:DUF1178 family protein [Labrys monachus]MDQ0396345.1 hypothetical protein [Labrys monachus]
MIRFSLVCDQGHAFESWFRDGASFDEQAERGLLSCPTCSSSKIAKAIMAPQVARKDREVPEPQKPVALVSPEEATVRLKIRELRAMLTEHSDYVGEDFAEQARRMHEGEIKHRSIYGEAKSDDVRGLIDDGIEVYPLPNLPDDLN